jgi:type IV secretory pathway VirJ component
MTRKRWPVILAPLVLAAVALGAWFFFWRGDGLTTVDLPPAGPAKAVAVIYSGDGGWRDLDKTIGEWLATQQYHAVGVDTLATFWQARDPATVAEDLAGIVRRADPSGKLPVLIIGYSFGADVFPFAWDKLPPALADRIRLITLLAPGRETSFHVSVEGWVGADTGDHQTLPAMAALPADRVLCVYGTDETDDSACTAPELAAVEKLATSGGHHFDEDYTALALKIVAAFEKRLN